MFKKILVSLPLVFNFAFSVNASTEAMRNADEMFLKRGDGIEFISRAQDMYEKIVKSNAPSADRIKAFDRFARLTVVEGELARFLYDYRPNDTKAPFQRCIDLSEQVSPRNIGEDSVEYEYWLTTCRGLWAKHASKWDIMKSLGWITSMWRAIEDGAQDHPEFDSNGFRRMHAGALAKPKNKILEKKGLYDPKVALEIANDITKNGTDLYVDYVIKAEAQKGLKDKKAARKTLEEARAGLTKRLANNDFPYLYSVENKAYLKMIDKALSEL